MSSFITRPSFPVPGTCRRSMLCSLAIARTAGVQSTGPDGWGVGAVAGVLGRGALGGAVRGAASVGVGRGGDGGGVGGGVGVELATGVCFGPASFVSGTSRPIKGSPTLAMSPTLWCSFVTTPVYRLVISTLALSLATSQIFSKACTLSPSLTYHCRISTSNMPSPMSVRLNWMALRSMAADRKVRTPGTSPGWRRHGENSTGKPRRKLPVTCE
mmetsp:Transcript_18689/g.31342  ORF Transcript_18689/g.31342 Transcript_18689/m.31342 type:complete len:214 (-) Transcript_18689:83-724(-)